MAVKTITFNRKAYHDYLILDTIEAGLALTGSEIKSIRAGKVSLREAYARSEAGELWLLNAHIGRYEAASFRSHDPTRPRKLLLHRNEIEGFSSRLVQKGLTLVPLRLYIRNGLAKVELGLAKGKTTYDKREVIARRDAERELRRAVKVRQKGK